MEVNQTNGNATPRHGCRGETQPSKTTPPVCCSCGKAARLQRTRASARLIALPALNGNPWPPQTGGRAFDAPGRGPRRSCRLWSPFSPCSNVPSGGRAPGGVDRVGGQVDILLCVIEMQSCMGLVCWGVWQGGRTCGRAWRFLISLLILSAACAFS